MVLPSGNTVDRTTIASYLLGDACDPFTRQPMTLADVVPSKFDTISYVLELWPCFDCRRGAEGADSCVEAFPAMTRPSTFENTLHSIYVKISSFKLLRSNPFTQAIVWLQNKENGHSIVVFWFFDFSTHKPSRSE